MQNFILKGPYIKLDQLLKAAGVCGSGGEAKTIIFDEQILVNGEIETRRGRKIKAGDVVTNVDGSVSVSVI